MFYCIKQSSANECTTFIHTCLHNTTATARKQIMELYGGNFYKVLLKLTESPYSEVQYNCAGVIGHLAINGRCLYQRVNTTNLGQWVRHHSP